jgi:glycerophosphoryl diester phosphodiesterase
MPSVLVAGIFDTFMPGEINAYHANGYRFISLNYNTVTEQLISLCHQIGIVVYVWTVDDEKDMRRLIAWNVDGIYSNRPDVLRSIVGEADQKCDVF